MITIPVMKHDEILVALKRHQLISWNGVDASDLTWHGKSRDFSGSPYVNLLAQWKSWLMDRGLIYLPAGSTRSLVPPGHWFIKTYTRGHGEERGRISDRPVAYFNEADAVHALLFRQTWGQGVLGKRR